MTAPQQSAAGDRTLDSEEVERFSKLASEWWNPTGKFRPLHQIGPPRLSFIRDSAVERFGRDAKALRPLSGLTAIDIGCGGGLVAEPLARMGATVTAIDPSERNITIAKSHAEAQGVTVDYRVARVEDLVAERRSFDIVACLEVVEHVPDPAKFVGECASLVAPGGIAIFSTLNRTFKAWALAIVGAEYVLGWLPRGTHQWDRFITPEELKGYTTAAGLDDVRLEGITYNPLKDEWSRNPDTDVNYLMSARKAQKASARHASSNAASGGVDCDVSIGDDDTGVRTVPVVTYGLIAANVLFFLIELSCGDEFIQQWAFIPSRFTESPATQWPTIFTAMFMHGGWMHLFGNMLYLYIFGDNVEDSFGPVKYLIFYLFAGIAATFTQYYFNEGSGIPNVGASGAIAGVLGAYILMFPNARVDVLVVRQVISMPSLIVIGFWIVLQLFSGVGSIANTDASDTGGVAYMAHVGGFAAGLLVALLFSRRGGGPSETA